jgi:hypothetical protein
MRRLSKQWENGEGGRRWGAWDATANKVSLSQCQKGDLPCDRLLKCLPYVSRGEGAGVSSSLFPAARLAWK